MSVSQTATSAGWATLLRLHGISVTHAHGAGAPQTMLALDNGTPEEVSALAIGVESANRSITLTRTAGTYAHGDTVVISGTTYRVLGVRHHGEFATTLFLGATVVSGLQ